MKRHMKGSDNSFWGKKKKNNKEEAVIYHLDTSTIAPGTSTHIISYFWKEPLEKISNSEIQNSVILENSTISRSVISDSVIGTNSKVKGLKAHSLKVGDYSIIANGTV